MSSRIKTSVNNTPPKPAVPKYPYIGAAESRCIVLFDKKGCGTCLDVGTTANRVGVYDTTWGESLFTPLNGSFVMEQEA